MNKIYTKKIVFHSLAALTVSALINQYSFAEPIIKEPEIPQAGWYASLTGGGTYSPSFNLPPAVSAATGIFGKVKGDMGWNAGIAFGRQHGPWRIEGQLLYMEHIDRDITLAGVTPPGFAFNWDTKLGAAMANIYLDFHNYPHVVKPYIGAGIGYAYIRNSTTIGTATLPITDFRGNDHDLAYQGIAGVAYHYSESGSISLDYRYFATSRVRFTGSRFQNHTLNLTITQRFNL